MSLRPRVGAPNPRRGGDGRRRAWSESKIPRVASRRVRMGGAVVVPCEGYNLDRATFGSTGATYTGNLDAADLVVGVAYDCTYTGTVDMRVRVDSGGTWTAWSTITGPELAGYIAFDPVENLLVSTLYVEWSVADAFTTVCASVGDDM